MSAGFKRISVTQFLCDTKLRKGSSYTGAFKNGRMEGEGEYKFPTETRYVGEMKNGMIHGKGVLHFTNGSQYEGTWEKGISKHVCSILSVQFYTERCNGLKPAGESQLTDLGSLRVIPDGCYDCGDGFYDPNTRVITNYEHHFLRNAAKVASPPIECPMWDL
ncbi:hypothetical protein J4Q44_G00131520 [Coregonus suidteri]|uniref:MORN repeat-containing protein 5 n=1 Tax=Coregonus suidteri TaxID=861788 RepID=A0AAN8LNC6_9TELE